VGKLERNLVIKSKFGHVKKLNNQSAALTGISSEGGTGKEGKEKKVKHNARIKNLTSRGDLPASPSVKRIWRGDERKKKPAATTLSRGEKNLLKKSAKHNSEGGG